MPRARRRRRRLSMTSLIDVIFLLLLFFMLSSTFTRFAEVNLATGTPGTGEPLDRPVFLRLAQDRLSLNGRDMALDALAGALREDEGESAARSVLVSLSGEVNAQRLTDLLLILRGLPGLQVTVLGQA
ncbi:biopolymer transporter ExbD [Sulfitobacter sp. LCG007]